MTTVLAVDTMTVESSMKRLAGQDACGNWDAKLLTPTQIVESASGTAQSACVLRQAAHA